MQNDQCGQINNRHGKIFKVISCLTNDPVSEVKLMHLPKSKNAQTFTILE